MLKKLIVYVCAVVFVCFVVGVAIMKRKPDIESFQTSFGYLNDDISNGNQGSMSNVPNPYLDANIRGQQDPIIYQSQGNPLLHEAHATTPVKNSMFYFKDHQCRPECCLYSPYSCSNGCVCWEAPPQPHLEQNMSISPRS
jgi:hypothetical protein